MANRRKFLAGLGALASGSAAAVGTGAFSSVSADRSITVSTADDSNALLAFQQSDNDNAEYADTTGNTVSITTSNNSGGNGLNDDSLTRILDMFNVVNQGTQPAVVYVDPESIPSNKRTTSSGFGVDPQATGRPNGSYDPENSKDVSDPGANLEGEISLTGIYDGPEAYAAGLTNFVLDAGQSFEFGLYVKNANDFNGNVPITVTADTDLVPDSYTPD